MASEASITAPAGNPRSSLEMPETNAVEAPQTIAEIPGDPGVIISESAQEVRRFRLRGQALAWTLTTQGSSINPCQALRCQTPSQRASPKFSTSLDPMLTHTSSGTWVSLGVSSILFVLFWVYRLVLGEDSEAPVEFYVPIPDCCQPGWVGHGEWVQEVDEEDEEHVNPLLGQYRNARHVLLPPFLEISLMVFYRTAHSP